MQVKRTRRYWSVHFILLIITLYLGSALLTFGLFAPVPPNACNTPAVFTVFDEDIIGDLTVSTPNISTPLGGCTRIEIYTHNFYPFTLQIIDNEGNLYASFPHFANNTYGYQYVLIELLPNIYTLLALRETQDASIDLSVKATQIYPVLPCIDRTAMILRFGFPVIGIILICVACYSGYRLVLTLRDQHP